MYIWINKGEVEEVNSEYSGASIFNILDKQTESNIKSNIEEIWTTLGKKQLKAINEDLLIIALSIFAIDKRIFRRNFKDCWTRDQCH